MIDYEDINRDLASRAHGWVAVKLIRSEVDYREALEELERLVGTTEDSPEDALLDVLSTLVAAYEAQQDC